MGPQDTLVCAEEVVPKKVARESECNKEAEDELPPMPMYNSSTNYYELYWDMFLRNEALMA